MTATGGPSRSTSTPTNHNRSALKRLHFWVARPSLRVERNLGFAAERGGRQKPNTSQKNRPGKELAACSSQASLLRRYSRLGANDQSLHTALSAAVGDCGHLFRTKARKKIGHENGRQRGRQLPTRTVFAQEIAGGSGGGLARKSRLRGTGLEEGSRDCGRGTSQISLQGLSPKGFTSVEVRSENGWPEKTGTPG